VKKSIIIGYFSFIPLFGFASGADWAFEFHLGTAYNVPMPLVISQQGQPDINMIAKYRTDAFTPPVYWDWRFSRWKDGKSWEFEAIHHKLYLDNTTTDVSRFGISHGFNFIIINRGYDYNNFRLRVGGGLVFSHPESVVRGLKWGEAGDPLDMGYRLSGPLINFAVAKPIHLTNHLFINIEGRTTMAYSRVPVVNGHADVFNIALQIVAGMGTYFVKK
jgi:hypothetical protein